MLTAFILQNLAQVFTEHMLNGMAQSLVLATLAWALLKVIGRRSSSTRFMVWFVVLLGTVALPLMASVSWHRAATATSEFHSAILLPSSWAMYLFCIWVAVVVVLMGRVGLGLWQIRRLRENCAPLDVASLDLALWQAVADSCRRPVEFYASPSLRVPMATGFFRPMIVLPEWAVRELSSDELKVVLLHEAAHLRRWDDWTNLAQKMLRAVFFFHPVVWWIEGRLALEREMACDDLVVAETSSPRAYAQCLIALAEKSLGRRNLAFAQAAVDRVRHTALRIRQILDGKRSGATRVWKPAVGLITVSAMACLLSVQETPKLVGFQSRPAHIQVLTAAAAPAPVIPSIRSATPLLQRVALAAPLPRSRVKLATTQPAVALAPPVVAKEAVVAQETDGAADAQAFEVKLTQRQGDQPRGVAFREVELTTSETVFVVLQDQEFNSAGDKVVRFNVYRLTVYYPGVYQGFYPITPRKPLSKSI